MPVNEWLRPPRHLVVIFLGVSVVLTATLTWLGWRMLQQDRALEEQRVRERLERTADATATDLVNRLDRTQQELAQLATLPDSEFHRESAGYLDDFPEDVMIVRLSLGDLAAVPSSRLLYYPNLPTDNQPSPAVFARGEAMEFQQRDYATALRIYGELARSRDDEVRAGALLRLARTQRKRRDVAGALRSFESLARLESTTVDGLPAGLVGRFARLDLLEQLSGDERLKREADSLSAALNGGRWRITRATYQFYVQELERWIASDSTTLPAAGLLEMRVALAEGVAWLWGEWQSRQRREADPMGSAVVWVRDTPVLAVWSGTSADGAGLLGGARYFSEHWVAAGESIATTQGATLAFADAAGRPLTSFEDSTSSVTIARASSETNLPWTFHVTPAGSVAVGDALAERRRLLVLGVAVVTLMAIVGLYAVARGVSRELEVARLQSEFVAAVSHEFRTPLTSLRQLTELLASGRAASDERRAKYYRVIERESARLQRLVEGLLDFGRMEAGAREFRYEHGDVNQLVVEVVEEFESAVGESGHHVVLTPCEAGCRARVDKEALRRALWNLLDNAVKYSRDDRTVRVEVAAKNGQATVAVRDCGVGIPERERSTIFQKFVRGSASRGTAVRGTGIGLAMVQHIVEAHNGRITVESEEGVGSTFTIELPLAGASQ